MKITDVRVRSAVLNPGEVLRDQFLGETWLIAGKVTFELEPLGIRVTGSFGTRLIPMSNVADFGIAAEPEPATVAERPSSKGKHR